MLIVHCVAASQAKAAGFCHAKCTEEEIARWAKERGRHIPGTLGAYACAFSSEPVLGRDAADNKAEALGLDPHKMFTEATTAARSAGYCGTHCTTMQVSACGLCGVGLSANNVIM